MIFSPLTGMNRPHVATSDEQDDLQRKRAIVEALARDPAVRFEALREMATAPVLRAAPLDTAVPSE